MSAYLVGPSPISRRSACSPRVGHCQAPGRRRRALWGVAPESAKEHSAAHPVTPPTEHRERYPLQATVAPTRTRTWSNSHGPVLATKRQGLWTPRCGRAYARCAAWHKHSTRLRPQQMAYHPECCTCSTKGAPKGSDIRPRGEGAGATARGPAEAGKGAERACPHAKCVATTPGHYGPRPWRGAAVAVLGPVWRANIAQAGEAGRHSRPTPGGNAARQAYAREMATVEARLVGAPCLGASRR